VGTLLEHIPDPTALKICLGRGWVRRSQLGIGSPEEIALTPAGEGILAEIELVRKEKHDQALGGPLHALDFSSLQAGGTTYHFTTPLQQQVIATLFAEWHRSGRVDGCGLTVAAMEEKLPDSKARQRLRVDRLFKNHPALDTILRKSGKSVWALHLGELKKAQR
jgi:hypothetical protein